jgi:hypothetical protein
VSVSDVVTDAFNTLQVTARAKEVTLSCDLSPDLPSARADQTRLRQILIILLDNAVKFTAGGGTVKIRAGLLHGDPEFLLLEVSDTGCGFRPEAAERIFERDYQVSASTLASRKGLGLGLYICKELVTRQGGRIWAQGQPQKGSIFSFTLPVFSLNNVIAPLLNDDKWPAESVALVTVCSPKTWRSKDSRDEWIQQARSLTQRCLLPDMDVLLPKMSSDADGERFFVAAFAEEKGAAALAIRIREQFERHLKQSDRSLSVSYSMLPPIPQDVGASTENIVTRMARSFEESIKSTQSKGYLS